jgi:hypothetical protein
MEAMEKKKRGPKTFKPIVLKFTSIDHDKLDESIDFKKYIYENTVKAIKFALNYNKPKCEPFAVGGLNTLVSLPKEKFGKVLDKMIIFYENQSNFEKCNELVKLKEKCNG